MGGNFWAVEFLLHAAGLFHLGRFFQVPTPCPLPLLQYAQEVGLSQREGEFYFSFPKGAVGPLGNPPS